jgi:hypothetical protein
MLQHMSLTVRPRVQQATFSLANPSYETGWAAELTTQYRLTRDERAPARSKLCFFGTAGFPLLERFKNTYGFGLVLSLMVPGAGHLLWRDYLFGIFVFLVMLTAVVLFFFSFLVELPVAMKAILFGLPTLFYVFTFVDLWRTVKRKAAGPSPSATVAWGFVVSALVVALALPLSPWNFALRNRPLIEVADGDELTPVISDGDICLIDRLAYHVDLFFLDQTLGRRLPGRWETVRLRDTGGAGTLGLVLAYGGEEVAFFNDSLFVDGYPLPDYEMAPFVTGGHLPLTRVEMGNILVATIDRGTLKEARQVSNQDVVGRVYRLF